MKKRPFPRWSRGGKILRNLLLVLMLAVFLWGLNDFRVPGFRWQFRMVEQANWADPLDIQGEFESEYDRWILASGRDQLVFWTEGRSGLEYWPRAAEGPTLAPVPESRSVQGDVQVAAADVPEGTASARLELTVGCWYKRNGTNGWTFDSRAEQPGDMPPLTSGGKRPTPPRGSPWRMGPSCLRWLRRRWTGRAAARRRWSWAMLMSGTCTGESRTAGRWTAPWRRSFMTRLGGSWAGPA